MIRSSKHTLKHTNISKQQDLKTLVANYRLLVKNIIDFIWINGYKNFNISKNKLNLPSFLDSTFLKNFDWNYSERLKQAAGKQAISMLSAATQKRKQQLWKLKQLQKEKLDTKYLQRVISLFPLIKPNVSNINLELDSRFINFKFDKQNKFLGFIKLSSIKKGLSINIPIVKSPVFDKWNNLGKLKSSIRLSEKYINIFFDIEETIKKEIGEVVGCDQGITDIVTFSDKQLIQKYQGKYTLSDVQKILSRRKKGSKGFKRAQAFRENLINYSLNQLNFENIKEIRLEKLHEVRKGKRSSRFLSHWTYTVINNKLMRLSDEKGFRVREVPNEFRSQRCSECGWVRKVNRKGKTFCCIKCGKALDADENAASNLLLDLYEIPYWVRLRRMNIEGFYWEPDGLFTESHESIVRDA